jgi:hypothetical protein
MSQLQLPMLTVYQGPKLMPAEVVASVNTYREAVQKCFELRTRPRMSNALIAEEVGCCASHIGDFVTHGARKTERDLPAKYIQAFEVCMGNRVITQWQMAQANLTILETFIQRRVA